MVLAQAGWQACSELLWSMECSLFLHFLRALIYQELVLALAWARLKHITGPVFMLPRLLQVWRPHLEHLRLQTPRL